SVFDSQGRFAPEFDPTDRSILQADTVILAIGQSVDLEALGAGGPTITPRGTISIDPETGMTSLEGVWAGGDAAFGPRNLIDAVADGQRMAASIHRSFGGRLAPRLPGELAEDIRFQRLLDRYDRGTRVAVPSLASDRRIGLREVEVGYTEAMARLEAERCLRCFANIQLEVEACVLCGLCSDVCPFDLISLVPASEIEGGWTGTALLLDESRCIRCALCIERCPTNALSMSTWTGVGVPVEVA
ncbi:MAG TPA: 4Fe-4S binding protein, partial [Acidimicrobiia bacterium]